LIRVETKRKVFHCEFREFLDFVQFQIVQSIPTRRVRHSKWGDWNEELSCGYANDVKTDEQRCWDDCNDQNPGFKQLG
jgi:hypothetical protein